MNKSNPEVQSDPDLNPQGEGDQRQSVGKLFGIELSAPKGMQNPLGRFIVIIAGNFLLLFLLSKAF